MRFLIVASLLVGVALGSPIGQVEVTTVIPQDLARSDLELNDATTVVVEILADDATVASATDRARQAPAAPAPAAGEDESNEDNEEEEATTASSGGSGSGGSTSSTDQSRPQPAIPQPPANASNFLAEYEFSSQFNLGPKDESLPQAVVVPGQAQPAVPAVPASAVEIVPQVGTPEAPSTPAEPAAPSVPESSSSVAPPALPPASPSSTVATPLSAEGAPANASVAPAIVAAGEDEDDAESEEEVPTEAPSARLQPQTQQQQVAAQRIEESDSDNEIITNDDLTTVRSFASEYQEIVQKLGTSNKRRGETPEESHFPTTNKLTSSLPSSSSLLVPLSLMKPVHQQQHEPQALNFSAFGISRLQGDRDPDFDSGAVLSDGEGRAACECGKLPFRVPIGSEAEINLRPWTVAIVRGGLIAGGRPHCAGVLINDRYVLSSASCMDGLHPNGIQVWLTAHNTLYNHHLNVGTSKLNVQEVIVHPNYHRGSHSNDICLIKMTQPVDISTSSSYFTPICLPSGNHVDYAGRYGMIFGWGYGRVNRICTAEVPILDNSVCQRDTRHGARVTDSMMCAGFLTPTAPVRTEDCLGDAGGPLTIQLNGRMSLIGVTSWGYEYHHRGHNPTVYTRVSGYADWILHNTEDADWCVG